MGCGQVLEFFELVGEVLYARRRVAGCGTNVKDVTSVRDPEGCSGFVWVVAVSFDRLRDPAKERATMYSEEGGHCMEMIGEAWVCKRVDDSVSCFASRSCFVSFWDG